MTDDSDKKSAAEQLRQALAARKNAAAPQQPKLRPDPGKAKANKDAERRAGKSRKVH